MEYSGKWVDNLFEGPGKLWDEAGNSVHEGNFLGGKVDIEWEGGEESLSSDISAEKTPKNKNIHKGSLFMNMKRNFADLESSKESGLNEFGSERLMVNRTTKEDHGP